MGQPCARLTDHISHGGAIDQVGQDSVYCNGLPVARITDGATCLLHGPVTIVGGSTSVFCEGLGVARVGDALSCGAVISSGSPNVFVGG